jgi:anti-sigma B factor antagonist
MNSFATLRRTGGRAVLVLTGDVDMVNSPALGALICSVLQDPDVPWLIVDLDRVAFLDCTGVSTLMSGRAAALRLRKRYFVINQNGCVERVLRLTGALAALQPPSTGHAVRDAA